MKTLVLIAVVALTGCAAPHTDLVALRAAIQEGKCYVAASIAGNTNDNVKYNNLGVVAEDCEHNQQKARSYYEYGARVGDQNAVSNLLRLGLPVPSADIAAQNAQINAANAANAAANAAAMNNAMMLIQASQPKFDPPPRNININCQSRNAFGTVYTNCN